ncbi:MAG: glycine betaine/L-proline ABC transporter substrate-binding protein ProX [Elainellaceae cyanobacterium]
MPVRSPYSVLAAVLIGFVFALGIGGLSFSAASQSQPISIARATWDTGWFQAEVYKQLLQELGYSMNEPRTMDNEEFYQQAADGTVDFWVNGWFPQHNSLLTAEAIANKLEPIGFEVRDGALQGYQIDLASAQQFNIKTLEDLQNPTLARRFDVDGNGKADLIGCNEGWSCAEVVNHHLDVYGLNDTVEHIQGDYTPLMEDLLDRYRQGLPILFYTWTPNWTGSQFVPGQDVVWLEVPYPSLPPDQQELESETIMTGIAGCVSDPCDLGFPRNDIRAVANTAFLDRHPRVRSLLEQVEIPLEDIAAQNAQMLQGEDSTTDIQLHAEEWIQANRERVDRWLEMALQVPLVATREDAAEEIGAIAPEPQDSDLFTDQTLRVVTKIVEPFVSYDNRQYQGFSIDLWNAIAEDLGATYELVGVNSVAKLLDDVERGAADVAIAGLGITSQREATLDFSHPYYQSGLQIMVLQTQSTPLEMIWVILVVLVRSPQLYIILGSFILILVFVAHLIWWSEHQHNSQFPSDYAHGIWEAFWWAAVTVTTVGYGDKIPIRPLGRFFGLIWMFSGYFIFAYFTASVATTFTVQGLQGQINGFTDLPGKSLATASNSAAEEYLSFQTNLSFKSYDTQDEILDALLSKQVDAVVYDAPVLIYYASHEGRGKVKLVGAPFQEINYGMALQDQSLYREAINGALLRLFETGRYQDIYDEWFG